MSDFVIRKNNNSKSKNKLATYAKPTTKEATLFVKVIAFVIAFSGLILMSTSNDNLMLSELVVSGVILSIVFFIHNVSNY